MASESGHLDDAGGAQQQGEVAHLALYALKALPAEDRERVPEVGEDLRACVGRGGECHSRLGQGINCYLFCRGRGARWRDCDGHAPVQVWLAARWARASGLGLAAAGDSGIMPVCLPLASPD